MENLEQEAMAGTQKAKRNRTVLVTAALPYINNVPHLGHIVGSHLPADIFARYCRAKGYDTLFVGGSDDNGTPSEFAAECLGVDINTFCDKLHQAHKSIYEWFGISYDLFSRTSKPVHHQTSQDFFKTVYDKAFVSKGRLKSFYCPSDDRFLPDRYVEGTCSKCGYEHANSDQCEKCTSVLDAGELLNPRCKLCSSKPVIKESNHLFLRLDKISPSLEVWINQQNQWRPQVRKLALGWINDGLRERCITRDLKHGVKVPLKGYEDKVLYVWFEAPIGYLSFTKEADPEHWQRFWKDKDGEIVHFLGKDNIPFHTIFWPAMLLANGEFNLPTQVVGLQYLNYEGGKFSKSQKRGVFCENLPSSGLNPDVMRAYLTFLIPETNDAEFKWRDFQRRVNSDVIGNLGNLVNRTISFIHNKLGGEIQRPSESELSDDDRKIIESTRDRVRQIGSYLEKTEIRAAFQEVLSLSSEGNKYFEDTHPWTLVKTDLERARKVLYMCASLCRSLAIVVNPYLPNTSRKIFSQLGVDADVEGAGVWDSAEKLSLPKDYKIGSPEILLTKMTDDTTDKLRETLSATKDLSEYFK